MKIFYLLFFVLLIAIQVRSQPRINSASNIEAKTKFYPNPAVAQITFSFEKGYDKNFSFQIFNFIGKKVFELPALAPKALVDVSNFYRGVYIFQVRDRNGKIIESGKFQVAR